MKAALIGYTGFVGQNLVRQFPFSHVYNSRNIQDIKDSKFDLVVCAGVQAKKWWANQNPEEDWKGIEQLLETLRSVQAGHFVLISTVDVYPSPKGVTEDSPIQPEINHAYGRHRFRVEEFVREKFPNSLILRLPGLFGHGIKKNVIHDLLKRHELEKINPRGVFQYYNLGRLGGDIQRARELGLRQLNLSTEPLGTTEILHEFFPGVEIGPESEFASNYDMKSLHHEDWGSPCPGYLYSKDRVLADLKTFIAEYTGSL